VSQITTGVRAVLSRPGVYSTFQTFMGAHAVRTTLAREFIRMQPGQSILDVGCGPADILDYLPAVNYVGFDISDRYITQAREKYGSRGQFFCKYLEATDLASLPRFDVVLGIGVLHHMDDDMAAKVLLLMGKALKPGGRAVTMDPCFSLGQNAISRFLVARDRGQNVRTEAAYAHLARDSFGECRTQVRHQAWIPYTRCFMVCTST